MLPRRPQAISMFLLVAILGHVAIPVEAQTDRADRRTVTCLGRLEPNEGVIRVAGPSAEGAVVAELLVEEGERVDKDQTLAVLETNALRRAEHARLKAELENAERELARTKRLVRNSAVSQTKHDDAKLAVRVARADLDAATARLEMSVIRAPLAGQVLEIHARGGERLGPEGILELGQTDQMYAVAEVYETDIGLVRVGQRASIASPALPGPVGGKVERIGLKVGKLDLFDTDPIARTDARVVEVRIRLDDHDAVARLTNLQVQIEILP